MNFAATVLYCLDHCSKYVLVTVGKKLDVSVHPLSCCVA